MLKERGKLGEEALITAKSRSSPQIIVVHELKACTMHTKCKQNARHARAPPTLSTKGRNFTSQPAGQRSTRTGSTGF